MTRWVKTLIAANAAAFLVTWVLPQLVGAEILPTRRLMFVPALFPLQPWTIITYMFLHAGLWHLLFNMLALYFFGPRLEARLGGRQFLWLYFVSGIMGAVLSIPFTPRAAIVGASGAVFGVLLGFARYWPRERIYVWGILPIEARGLVVIMTILALWGGLGGARAGVAHFAHLGGFLGGYLYLKWWERRSPAAQFRTKARPSIRPSRGGGGADLQRWAKIQRDEMHPVNREELDRVLDKINATGVSSLSAEEREFLERFSSR